MEPDSIVDFEDASANMLRVMRIGDRLWIAAVEGGPVQSMQPKPAMAREIAAALLKLAAEVDGEVEGWRPIESAPGQEEVLVCRPGMYGCTAAHRLLGEWRTIGRYGGDRLVHPPTYWMKAPALPAPPSSGTRSSIRTFSALASRAYSRTSPTRRPVSSCAT